MTAEHVDRCALPEPVHAVVGIARLAAMTGATLRALRHYEEVGLLRPVRTRSGGRLFTPRQCETAVLIVLLRRCDVPIAEIRDVIDAAGDPAVRLRAALEAQAGMLDQRLRAIQEVLASTEANAGDRSLSIRAA
jgi:DNA-binding transcriptional MerR regulator